MNRSEIPAWLESTRTTAKLQAQRWEGVDPSRLLEACDLIEELLQPNAPVGDGPIMPGELAVRQGVDTGWRLANYADGREQLIGPDVLRQVQGGRGDTIEQDMQMLDYARQLLRDPEPGIRRYAQGIISELERRRVARERSNLAPLNISPKTAMALHVVSIQRLRCGGFNRLPGSTMPLMPEYETRITIEGLLDRTWAPEDDQMLALERSRPDILIIPH